MRVLMAGGGTGGHLFPALAIAEELRRQEPGVEILFIGSDRGLERDVVTREGYDFAPIRLRGWSRRLNWKAFQFPLFLFLGLLQSYFIVRRFRPDVAIGTGGYVSGPAVMWSALMGLPTLIQEQNSLPGVTTRILSGHVDEVHLSFAQSRRYFRRRDHLRLSGNPLRGGVGQIERSQASRAFSFDPYRPAVLITGGSQGAHSINLAVADGFGRLVDRGVQVLWQTGSRDLEAMRQRFSGEGYRAVITDFIEDMSLAYAAVDVVVCRAGATTVAEVAACGLPAIFVPFPFATADHQRLNALAMVKAGAAEMVLNGELKEGRLIEVLLSLLEDESKRRIMALRSQRFGRPQAAATLVRAVRRLAEKRRR
jgi:UDP-N-acetylglucosamine--N-acetylmuramyl-(pentapeptide) pyrophosphoryl-undecaprenol N-acetylglucosamine transferase